MAKVLTNAKAYAIGAGILVALLSLWEVASNHSSRVEFFFSSPRLIGLAFVAAVRSGAMITDFLYTSLPTIVGLSVGVTLGCTVGFLLLRLDRFAKLADWYVVVLGSIPIFAIAPMMVVWFGVGLEMKVAIAILSTFFVSLSHAYRGGRTAPTELQQLFAINGGTNRDVFRKLILPFSLDWVFASLRLNANLAVLGVFIGEFMASEHGLAHAMLKASGLYQTSVVLAYALAMMLLVIGMDRGVLLLEAKRHYLIQLFAVNPALRHMRPAQ